MPRPSGLTLTTDRLVLSLLEPDGAERVAAYYDNNRAHHGPWDPPRREAFFTAAFWRERLAQNLREWRAGQSLRLFLRTREDPDGPVLGAINFTDFVRGPFQACRLGYTLDRAAVGRGLMTEALREGLGYVFEQVRLHRVEANYLPTNERSAAVLRRLGFSVNGYARDYLFIAGAWRDHILTSLTNPDPRGPDEPDAALTRPAGLNPGSP